LTVRGKSSPRDRAGLRAVTLLAGLLALAAAQAVAQAPDVESAVKATYLYKFAPFVQWPADAFTFPSDPLVLCVVGTDAVAKLVDDAVKGQSVGGRAVTVVHVMRTAREARCHMLYVAGRGEAAVSALDGVKGSAVLTVTDSAREARARGIINFVIQDNRVRFEIDLDTASENKLMISSKLLSLAASVRQHGQIDEQ
jgi:hypothetical protein